MLARSDPEELIRECERIYTGKITAVTDYIKDHLHESRVILLSGPSASGKTTTSHRINDALRELGIICHTVSLDDYFTEDSSPLAIGPDGEKDLESPYCMDLDLLNRHIADLSAGREVRIPRFDFAAQARMEQVRPLRLGNNEVVIFEGIHALNNIVASSVEAHAMRIYVRVHSEVYLQNEIFLPKNCIRLTRRILRDSLFRGFPPEKTVDIWPKVRKGEHKYIVPYIGRADIEVDTFMNCECGILAPRVLKLLREIGSRDNENELLTSLEGKLAAFEPVPDESVPTQSILREFIGGSVYE